MVLVNPINKISVFLTWNAAIDLSNHKRHDLKLKKFWALPGAHYPAPGEGLLALHANFSLVRY